MNWARRLVRRGQMEEQLEKEKRTVLHIRPSLAPKYRKVEGVGSVEDVRDACFAALKS